MYDAARTIATGFRQGCRDRDQYSILQHRQARRRRAWGALLVLCGALFLDALDVSMIGVALPSIRTDLHLSTSSLQWVVSAYVLGYGGFLLLGGRAADLLGRRRVFLISLAVFVVASGARRPRRRGAGFLIATRFIKGVSAAFTAPAGFSIITTTLRRGPGAQQGARRLHGDRRHRASRSGSSSAAC